MYPPRVKMTVGMKNPNDHNRYILSVKIEGCSEEDQLDIQLFFPPCIVFSITYHTDTCLCTDFVRAYML